LGDLEQIVCADSAVTVSQKDTTGSEITTGAPFMKSSRRSLMQISKCNSPAPAIICSPVFAVKVLTKGSDFESFLNPEINFGSSYGLLVLTETLTTGETVYFIILML